MKPYTLASERAAAPTGCAYIAPLLSYAWFRWENCRAAGVYVTGAEVVSAKPTNVQVFADGEWNPVVAYCGCTCEPALNYLQEVDPA